MARDTADGEASGTAAGQSKRPQVSRFDSSDQIPHHRVKSQRHIVGGGGSRLHARVPSTKALHKHHGLTSTTKLNRKHGSVSPERGNGLDQVASTRHHHRRATSELKLGRDSSTTDLKKNASQVSLKRNRSQAEVGKKSKSATNLHRSASNRAVDKIRSSGSSSKVHFNIGDEDEDEDDEDEGEWVDASGSASPLLSRRGSTISGTGQAGDTPTKNHHNHHNHQNISAALPTLLAPPSKPSVSHQDDAEKDQSSPNESHSPSRNTSHNQYLTSRILSRTPSHGAPPKMSTETALVRPVSPRQPSLIESSQGQPAQMRPGSSGGPELTSRFAGNGSQDSSSGKANSQHFGSSGGRQLTSTFLENSSQGLDSDTTGESFMRAVDLNKSGLSRAAFGGKTDITTPRRPRSMGSLSHGDAAAAEGRPASGAEGHGAAPKTSDSAATIVVPEDLNRTQQKLDLARESSGVEQTENPNVVGTSAVYGVFNHEKAPQEQPIVISRIIKRVGAQYDAVRKYQNPIARSIARIRQLPGTQPGQKIPAPNRARSAINIDSSDHHYRHDSHGAGGINSSSKRPVTPRGVFTPLRAESVASSYTEEVDPGKMHEGQKFSGAESTADDHHDAGLEETTALLMKMWNQRHVDLSASQD